MTSKQLFRALDFSKPAQTTVDSAAGLARAVGLALKSGDSVTISFHGYRAVSSSYFNALLVSLKTFVDSEQIRHRVDFETDSGAQRMILDRSFNAVIGTAA